MNDEIRTLRAWRFGLAVALVVAAAAGSIAALAGNAALERCRAQCAERNGQ